MTLDTAPETKDVPRGKAKANGKAAAAPEPTMRTVVPIPLDVIDIGPNVRVNVEAIDELAASIAEHGVLQPIKVRAAGRRWIVVWGQRRVLAARKAGLKMIPALTSIEDLPADRLSIEQLVENLHRADLNPIDRARAMQMVVDAGASQADLARKLGIAASTVSNDLRLLEGSKALHEALETGAITASHAKAMLPLPAKDQEYFIERVEKGNLSAHRLEEEVGWKLQTLRGEEHAAQRATKQAPKLVAALESAGIAKTTRIHLQTPYNMRGEAIESAIKKAGWRLGDRYAYTRERGDASKCDCDVVRVEFNRTWQIVLGCVDDKHRDRQVNSDHVAEEKRRKAIQGKLARLTDMVATVLESTGVASELVKLMAATHRGELADVWAFDGDQAETRQLAAQRLAAAADSSYVWPETDRAKHDAVLDEVLATFEAIITSRGDALPAATPA